MMFLYMNVNNTLKKYKAYEKSYETVNDVGVL